MVEEIIDRWRGPEFEFFKLLADDGKPVVHLLLVEEIGRMVMAI